jgi:hypothetical protein
MKIITKKKTNTINWTFNVYIWSEGGGAGVLSIKTIKVKAVKKETAINKAEKIAIKRQYIYDSIELKTI